MADQNPAGGAGTDVAVADHPEIAALKQQGALAVDRQREINRTTKQLAGMKWGEVSGQSLSDHTRYAIAKLCQLTGADPALHLYILGGRAYLNSDYWKQVVARSPYHLGYDEENVAAGHTAKLRKLADQAEQEGDAQEALEYRRAARRLDALRSSYGIPENAAAAYEGTLRRYAEGAPLRAINTGQVDGGRFIIEIREANWAGGKRNDPVGDARPGETARSRTLRRCAVKGYATTLAPMEEELRKLEDAIEAEFEIVGEDRRGQRAALPQDGERQALSIGGGEPAAARIPEPSRRTSRAAAAPGPAVQQAAEAESAELLRYSREVERGYEATGIVDTAAFCRDTIGKDEPETLDDYRTLQRRLSALAESDSEELSL